MGRHKKYEIHTDDDITYTRWGGMRSRVNHSPRYKHVTICPEWDDYNKFKEDMGGCPVGYSLERLDNNKGYFKENCKWIPFQDQSKNRRSNILVNGRPLKEACELVGVPYKTVWHRVKRQGYEPLIAITLRETELRAEQIREILS